MTHTRLRLLLLVVQHGAGLLNAYSMIGDLAEGNLFFAAVSAIVVLMVARWPAPPITRNPP